MPVTARFVPDTVDLLPDAPNALTLRLHNNEQTAQAVRLESTGDLADSIVLGVDTAAVEPNQTFDIAVTVAVGSDAAAGPHSPTIALTSECGSVDATFTANVVAHTEHTLELRPLRSRSSAVGRHAVGVSNRGNVEVFVEFIADTPGSEFTIEVASPVVVAPGTLLRVPVGIRPATTYWTGPVQEHSFTLRAESSDGSATELAGTFEQRPKVAWWIGPAVAGACAALFIGAIAWFALLRPWVEDAADDAATEAIAADRVALQEKIDELEAAAAEADELPLGEPTDLRLSVAPVGGSSDTDSQTIGNGATLSVTDVVFQNPTGAVGTVSLLRDGEVLLQSELANFRDYDLHLVAPYVFAASSEISLQVDCTTPGPGSSDCPVGAAILGFLD